MYKNVIKPIADVAVAFIALLILSPVWLLVLVLLTFANKGKPFFVQPRPGRNRKIFYVIKFRTMTDETDENGQLLSDEDRLTAVGNFVRKTSLDEIPQLFNVLIGDMSFVGPRPLLVEYLPLYSHEQNRRHQVTPGITGWAQVNGRNAVKWPERFRMDVYYVEHQSFWLDLKILWKTLFKVFKSEGISSGTSVTMEKFQGEE
jgi:lipopolysaccharide/colanic/teichoic acid biosynthesis glycosyltransferase